MTHKIYDPKEECPNPDEGFHICGNHSEEGVMVTHRSEVCPLCSAEKRVKSALHYVETYIAMNDEGIMNEMRHAMESEK